MAIELLTNKIRTFGGEYVDSLNPSDKHANIALSNGNLTAASTVSNVWKSARALQGHSTGKRQFEITLDVMAANNYCMAGIGTLSATLNSYVGSDVYGYGIAFNDGSKLHNGSMGFGGASLTAGDILGFCIDFDSRFIFAFKNGWIFGGTACFTTIVSGTYYVMVSPYTVGNQCTINFGATAFSYSVPGYLSWNRSVI